MMKSFVSSLIVLSALSVSAALAGQGSCKNQTLTCSVAGGPSASAVVEDIQPEPFDPADCEATVDVGTKDGGFSAIYVQRNNQITDSLRVLFGSSTQAEGVLLESVPLAAGSSLSVSAGSLTLSCIVN